MAALPKKEKKVRRTSQEKGKGKRRGEGPTPEKEKKDEINSRKIRERRVGGENR